MMPIPSERGEVVGITEVRDEFVLVSLLAQVI
jgi:hypothetical protein